MRPPRPEIKANPAARRANHPRRLRGNQRLEVHHAEKIGLEHLNVDRRRRDVYHGSLAKTGVPSGTAQMSPQNLNPRR